MVGYLKKVTKKLFGRKGTFIKGKEPEVKGTKILIYGLPSSGKKTIRDRLYDQSENAKYWNLDIRGMDFFEIYGRGSMRPIERFIYMGVKAVVYVTDRSSSDRFNEYYYIQRMMFEENLKDCPFAVVVNKRDLSDQFSAEEFSKEVGEETLKGRTWKLFPATANTGEGISDVYEWLTEQIGEPEAPTPAEDDSKEVEGKNPIKKAGKADVLSGLVSKFKNTFFLSPIKA